MEREGGMRDGSQGSEKGVGYAFRKYWVISKRVAP